MKRLYVLVFALFVAIQLYAQDAPAVSTEMNNARFEVIQNPNIRKYTFYLDKNEGNVYQLVKTRSGGFAWEIMDIYPNNSNTKYTESTYQIFIGGIAAADTFLIDTKTGRIWNLVQRPDESIVWEEMD